MRIAVRILLTLLLLAGLLFVTESMLQPKTRIVPLEGESPTPGNPEVTFMVGANMNPPVQTNPFLVVFSAVEGLSENVRMAPGSLITLSDSSCVFVWEVYGSRSVWLIDRVTHEIEPLFLRMSDQRPRFWRRWFPALDGVARTARTTEIQKMPDGQIRAMFPGVAGWLNVRVDERSRVIFPA